MMSAMLCPLISTLSSDFLKALMTSSRSSSTCDAANYNIFGLLLADLSEVFVPLSIRHDPNFASLT